MPYEPQRGDALLIPSGPSNDPDRLHLHGILTHRCGAESHLIVCVESIGDGYFDPTCVIEIGEHEFITKRSWVNYRRSQCYKASRLKKLVDGWVYKPKAALSEPLLERVCAGVMASPMTPRGMKTYYQAQQP
jgi:hypothetical protein